ncbi:MAG: retroviral-like aspartic protease family protein [Melioribacteraceae bacterium]|nr:retroviral-like aspartic protease family protein [Melioribacteraceae bacterium]
MPKYKSNPALIISSPIVNVEFSFPGSVSTYIIPAILDTGATTSVIPKKVVDSIGKKKMEYKWVRIGSASGNMTKRKILCNLKIYKCKFEKEIIELDKEFAIIGMDIINEYNIQFNGPTKNWRIVK